MSLLILNMWLITGTTALLAIWVISNIHGLIKNYLIARKCGFPVRITPINPDNFFWIITQRLWDILGRKYCPGFLFRIIQPNVYGWEAKDSDAYHRRYGSTFLLVTPGDIECWVADPEVVYSVLLRRKDFFTIPHSAQFIGFAGPNLLTSDGDSWARQRKLIAPNLNERISQAVWDEGTNQASQMKDYILKQRKGHTNHTVQGLKSLAINVLAKVAYGHPQTWSVKDGSKNEPKETQGQDDQKTIFEAVYTLITLIIFAGLMSSRSLRLPFMPKFLKNLGETLDDYPVLVRNLLENEQELLTNSDEPRNNLVSMLARLHKQDDTNGMGIETKVSSQHLSEKEICGNLFVFSAAGFDSTTNTMAYAVTLLNIYPEWQAWIQEELDTVFSSLSPTETPEYNDIFPRLPRCLALMHETLRFFPPLVHIGRWPLQPQLVVTASGKECIIPPNSKVYVNCYAAATDPKAWGEDAKDFRPNRWIEDDTKIGVAQTLIRPPRGSFVSWGTGPRACPGQKMSQVEFVAAVSTLYSKMKSEPVVRPLETLEQARQRLLEVMMDSDPVLALQMNHPERVKLQWTVR